MNVRQKIQLVVLLALIFFSFASYHPGSGSTQWLMWLTAVSFVAFVWIFDMLFGNDSQFIFDPDADNWRRKTVRLTNSAKKQQTHNSLSPIFFSLSLSYCIVINTYCSTQEATIGR